MRYWISLFLLIVGLFLAFKPQWIQEIYGRVGVAEQGVWSTFGGSRVFFQLIGLIMIILSVVLVFVEF